MLLFLQQAGFPRHAFHFSVSWLWLAVSRLAGECVRGRRLCVLSSKAASELTAAWKSMKSSPSCPAFPDVS